jgi:hypothetical protein
LRAELLDAGRAEGARGLIKATHRLLERPMVSALMSDAPPAPGSLLRLARTKDGNIEATLITESSVKQTGS